MTGEKKPRRVAAVRKPAPALSSRQPGGRAAAPGELALVQSFINSHYDTETSQGADLLATPAALHAWLLSRSLVQADDRVGEPELERALLVRSGLRTLVGGERELTRAGLAPLNSAAAGAGAELRFGAAGPRFVIGAAGGIDAALGLLLGLSAGAMLDGSWDRLKLCPGQDCGWAFYDRSRNRSGRWCSMSVCGGRVKARAYYRRSRGPQ